MSVQVMIDLPDALAQRAREVAEKTGLRLEDVIMAWIDHGRLIALPEIDETPAERGARLLREGERTRPAWIATWKKFLKDIGAEGEPIGAERLQQLMIEDGLDPNKPFSPSISEMREE
jgi:hypothetical protein